VAKKVEVDTLVRTEQSQRQIQEHKDTIVRDYLLESIKTEKINAESQRVLKQADYDLLKESYKDPVVAKLKYFELIGDLYGSISFSSFRINHMGDEDPIAQMVSKFTRMADDTI